MFAAVEPVEDDQTRPHLVVSKQTSVSEERVTKRGKTTNVFVVVKNSPFQLGIALKNALANFNYLAFDMSLLYDMPGFAKEVAYVSTKPIDLKSSINDIGDEISFDVKIKVLSSHHEDNHFRLRVVVWDPNNDSFPQLVVLSHPIKVISKPMNQRKPRGTKRTASQARLPKGGAEFEEPSMTVATVVPEVQHSPALEGSLSKLDLGQQELLRLVNQLVVGQTHIQSQLVASPAKRMKLSHHDDGEGGAPRTPLGRSLNPRPMDDSKMSGDFEGAFSVMLRSYSQMNAEEKAERTRKVLRALTARDVEQVEELFDIMATTGLKTQSNTGPSFTQLQPMDYDHEHNCTGDDCPHKVELSRIDQFYSEVFL